ncbi:MAG: hypothetical protein R3C05_08335 [Pirellulaceae bacterium]
MYCQTLIAAAAQTCRPPEPVVLGFANGEHPAARRIRRMMNGSLFRSPKLRLSAIAIVAVIALLVLPGMRAEEAPVVRTSLEGTFGGWRNLSFDPPAEELAILEACEAIVTKYRSSYHVDNESRLRFDDHSTREELEEIVKRKPGFFYPQHLLATWHRRNGDPEMARKLFASAFENAPVILSQRYQNGEDAPIEGLTIPEFSIECNRVQNRSIDQSLRLQFIDLTTDSNGEIKVPVYETVYRLSSRSIPQGYSTEMPRLGFFEAESRVGQIPPVTAWKSHSRPEFKRDASESAILSEATGTQGNQLTVGPNMFRIGRVARAQSDGAYAMGEDDPKSTDAYPPLPELANTAFMDHVVVDLASPASDRYEISEITVLDSRTKIPVQDFQQAAGVKQTAAGRFHLVSLLEKLPNTIDLVLDVHSFCRFLPYDDPRRQERAMDARRRDVHHGLFRGWTSCRLEFRDRLPR